MAREHRWDVVQSRVLVSYPAGTPTDAVEAVLAAAEDEDEGAFAFVEAGVRPEQDAVLLSRRSAGSSRSWGSRSRPGYPPPRDALTSPRWPPSAPPRGGGARWPRARRCWAPASGAAGAFVAYTARATTGSPEFVVPWANLAVTGLVVPLIAVLVATVFTPSRLPLAARHVTGGAAPV